MSISCNTSQRKNRKQFGKNLCFTHFCRNFKLFEFTHFSPPLDLVKFYTSLPFPPFETHFTPLSSTAPDCQEPSTITTSPRKSNQEVGLPTETKLLHATLQAHQLAGSLHATISSPHASWQDCHPPCNLTRPTGPTLLGN